MDFPKLIVDNYLSYLKRLDEDYQSEGGDYFIASSSGGCHLKNFFDRQHKIGKPFDNELRRRLRLGTLLHKDYEDAMEETDDGEYLVLPEHSIKGEIEGVLIKAKVDIAYVKDGLLYTGDYKSKNFKSWSFRGDVGLQGFQARVGAMLIAQQWNVEIQSCYIFSIDVDFGKFDWAIVPQTNEDVREYYRELKAAWDGRQDFGNPEVGGDSAPVENWECGYCKYKGIQCPGKPR